jgi:hypothetical protein
MYGSEFVAAKLAIQQIIGLRIYLWYLGVVVKGLSRLFGDNRSVVTSGSVPHSPLKKQHHAQSYHYTQEAVASKAVDFQFIPGHLNPADILSKHWDTSKYGHQRCTPCCSGQVILLYSWKDTNNHKLGNQRRLLPKLHFLHCQPIHLQLLPKGSDKYSIRTFRHGVKTREPRALASDRIIWCGN